MEEKLKYLEFLQNIITRLNSNSFMIKGWGVTLVAALFALSVKDSNKSYLIISLFLVIIFWILDGYFVSIERRFRTLWKKAIKLPNNKIDFSMDIRPYNNNKNTWIRSVISQTLLIFYGIFIFIVLIVIYLVC